MWKRLPNGLPVSSKCPLCPLEDGCTHILSGCAHPDMKSHYISRHNQAVLLIHKAISQGGLGGSFCVVDATKASKTPVGAESNRLPPWLLPDLTTAKRNKLRPDILLIQGLPTVNAQRFGNLTRQQQQAIHGTSQIHLIEVGYASNTRYTEKLAEKLQQHAELIGLLRDQGWKVQCHGVVLGTGAFIFNDTVRMFDTLLVPAPSKHSALQTLHRLAALKVHDILICRRRLEHGVG